MSNHRQENLWGSVILGLRSKIRFFRPWPQLLQGWLIRICGWQWDQRTARWPSGRAGWWKHMTKNTCICGGHMLLKQLLRAKQESRRQLNTMPCKMENWILDSRRVLIFFYNLQRCYEYWDIQRFSPPRPTFCNLASVTASSVQATSPSTNPSGKTCFLAAKRN